MVYIPLFRLGIFINNNKWDNTKHFIDPKKEPLMKVPSDILGLDYIELKPRLPILSVDKKKDGINWHYMERLNVNIGTILQDGKMLLII